MSPKIGLTGYAFLEESECMIFKNRFWRHILVVVLLGIVWLLASISPVVAEEPNISIATPDQGETISGLITVTGTVDFPDFLKFEIMLKTGDEVAWVATIHAPVIQGNLARLDSRLFLDGSYQLVVRQVNSDTNYTDYLGPTITIDNGLGSPWLHPVIESNFLYAPPEHALLRVRNCAQRNMEFDYNSPTGFCSAGDLWIMGREADSSFCPFEDVLLIPNCEYRGTVVGEGDPLGGTYSLQTEKGKIYQLDYPGGPRFYLGEVEGDEMVPLTSPAPAPTKESSTDSAKTPAEPSPTEEDSESKSPAPTEEKTSSEAETPDELLPVSGQGQITSWPFVGAAVSLILLLMIGGVTALRKRTYPA